MVSKFVNKLKNCYLPPYLTANVALFHDLHVCRVSCFFRFKDRFPLRFRSRVVYKFTYQWYQASYVGETCRLLQTRVSEHMGFSTYTVLSHSALLSILAHKRKTDNDASLDDFSILSPGSTQFYVFLPESMLISKLKPKIASLVSINIFVLWFCSKLFAGQLYFWPSTNKILANLYIKREIKVNS